MSPLSNQYTSCINLYLGYIVKRIVTHGLHVWPGPEHHGVLAGPRHARAVLLPAAAGGGEGGAAAARGAAAGLGLARAVRRLLPQPRGLRRPERGCLDRGVRAGALQEAGVRQQGGINILH